MQIMATPENPDSRTQILDNAKTLLQRILKSDSIATEQFNSLIVSYPWLAEARPREQTPLQKIRIQVDLAAQRSKTNPS